MSNQSSRQASVRVISGTQLTYEGDWHALFNVSGIPAGDFNGRFLQWLNTQIPEIKTNLVDAMASYAVNVAQVSSWNEVRDIGGLPPPVVGPLDFVSSESGTSLSVTFDLAAPIAALGVIVAYEGTLTSFTATHGGQPLALVRFDKNDTTKVATAMFIGNALTIESASLVVNLVGGAVGKAWVGRINDDYGYETIVSGWNDGDNGNAQLSKVMTVSGVDGTGKSLSVWGTTNYTAPSNMLPTYKNQVPFYATVVGGNKTAVTGWTTTSGWSEAAGVYTHTGANTGISKILSPTVLGPLGFDADVTLATGARMTLIMTPTLGTPTQRTITGPYTGKWSVVSEDTLTFNSLVVMALGNTTITNMNYIESPRLLVGAIGRSITTVSNSDTIQWQNALTSQYATTAIEIHNVPYDPDALALFARMTSQPSAARKSLINATIVGLKSAGIFSKLDALYLMASHDGQAAGLNWISSSFPLSPVNSPTFTADRGYLGDGTTNYLATGLTPSGSTKYQNLSAHMGVWCNVAGGASGGKTDIGSADAVSSSYIRTLNSATNATYRMNHNTASSANGVTTELGHTVTARTAVNATQLYKNGSLMAGDSTAALGAPATEFYICAQNSNGTASNFANRRYAAAHAGEALNASETMNLYNIINTYLTAVGGA